MKDDSSALDTATEGEHGPQELDAGLGYRILRTILACAPHAIAFVEDRTLRYVNDRFCELTGYSREELLGGTTRMMYLSDEEFERTGAEKDRQIEECGTGTVESKYRRKNGEIIDVALSCTPIDRQDHSKGLVATIVDITEQKRAEKVLLEAHQKFKDLAYLLPQTVFEIDMNGRVVFMNRYGLEELGYTEEDIEEGIAATEMIVPEDREHVADSIRRSLSGDFITGNEYLALRKDGTTVPIVTYSSPIRRGREIVGLRGLAVNISERKELETQLRHSQKMEAVGRLAGGLAHDFNNLLTGILGYSQLALDSLEEDHPARDHIETIRKTGENASELTERLLAFSRRSPISRRVVSVNDIVSGMDGMLNRLIGEDIELTLVLQPNLFNVQADANEIEHALVNLAVNARDAMPGGGELIVETRNLVVTKRSRPELIGMGLGEYATVAVSDTGVGMGEDVKSRAFEPFFTTKPDPKGTGLGLSIVYGIVTQNGGHVWIRSAPGKGTTVRIYLPRVAKEVQPAAEPVAEPESLRGTETVLVVEDQPVVRSLAARILRDKGYTVLEAGDGEEALRVSGGHRGHIHLMITDVVMPGMGGAELAERMSALRPEMKTIYMSGYTDDEIVRRASIDGAKTLILKPFTRELFTMKVRRELDND
jgi:PAS domain S-box-containing protein